MGLILLPSLVLCLHLKHIIDCNILLYFLKKLCSQIKNISSLECVSCRFAKHHRSSLSPRVNKRLSPILNWFILMFGEHALSFPKSGISILLLLWIMFLVWLGFISWRFIQKCLLTFVPSIMRSKHNSMLRYIF